MSKVDKIMHTEAFLKPASSRNENMSNITSSCNRWINGSPVAWVDLSSYFLFIIFALALLLAPRSMDFFHAYYATAIKIQYVMMS
jgi:hypothetical protein